jgi:hypothetical protein
LAFGVIEAVFLLVHLVLARETAGQAAFAAAE